VAGLLLMLVGLVLVGLVVASRYLVLQWRLPAWLEPMAGRYQSLDGSATAVEMQPKGVGAYGAAVARHVQTGQ
jgi:hypothetical protein